jgi:hypothetical protein
VRCLGAAVLAALVMSIFLNGTIGITLAQANAMGALRHVWRVMFTRWGQELLLVGELQASTHHAYQLVIIKRIVGYYGFFHEEEPQEGEEDREVSSWVTLRARWVTLRARWVTLRARWVTLRARWVTLGARRVGAIHRVVRAALHVRDDARRADVARHGFPLSSVHPSTRPRL